MTSDNRRRGCAPQLDAELRELGTRVARGSGAARGRSRGAQCVSRSAVRTADRRREAALAARAATCVCGGARRERRNRRARAAHADRSA